VPVNSAAAVLIDRYGDGAQPVVTRAPGRVNIIGGHMDYNGGAVLPFAVDLRTNIALRGRSDSLVRAYSASLREEVECELPLRDPVSSRGWSDYLVGILAELSRYAPIGRGFDLVITSDLPIGAGISSSAALEVAMAIGLSELYRICITGRALVRLCHRAEVQFVGANCGVMDQYVCFFAEPHSALLIDARSFSHRVIPLLLGDHSFMLVDTGTPRSLIGSDFNERWLECRNALEWLRTTGKLNRLEALADLPLVRLQRHKLQMPPHLFRRALHVVEEHQRVQRAVSALEKGDVSGLGQLLLASHASLRNLLEVSTDELDFLVRWGETHGALGARLVGAGFGGATLHLIPDANLEEFAQSIRSAYYREFAKQAHTILIQPSSGAKLLHESKPPGANTHMG